MTKMAPLVPCAALLAALCLAACGGGPEGTFKLDKAATKKEMEADAAKLTGKAAEAAKLGISFVESMDGTLELKPGGTLTQTLTMTGLGGKGAAPKEETGTWKKVEGGLTLDIGKQELTCTHSSKSLTCKDSKGHGTGVLVWTKS